MHTFKNLCILWSKFVQKMNKKLQWTEYEEVSHPPGQKPYYAVGYFYVSEWTKASLQVEKGVITLFNITAKKKKKSVNGDEVILNEKLLNGYSGGQIYIMFKINSVIKVDL